MDGSIYGRVTLGFDKSEDWGNIKVSTWGGLQGRLLFQVAAGATRESPKYGGGLEGEDIFLKGTGTLTLRGGIKGRINVGWWSWTAAAYAFADLRDSVKLHIWCDKGGCSFKGLKFGSLHGDFGFQIGLGAVYTMEWQI